LTLYRCSNWHRNKLCFITLDMYYILEERRS